MQYVEVGRISDFPTNTCRPETLPGGESIVVINLDDNLHVLENRCEHGGHSLDQLVIDEEGRVLCPLHGWEIDVERGICLAEPDCVFKVYPVRIEGDRVMVGCD